MLQNSPRLDRDGFVASRLQWFASREQGGDANANRTWIDARHALIRMAPAKPMPGSNHFLA